MKNDFKGILVRWDFPKGFFKYAGVLGLRRPALGRFQATIIDFRGILGLETFLRGFLAVHGS